MPHLRSGKSFYTGGTKVKSAVRLLTSWKKRKSKAKSGTKRKCPLILFLPTKAVLIFNVERIAIPLEDKSGRLLYTLLLSCSIFVLEKTNNNAVGVEKKRKEKARRAGRSPKKLNEATRPAASIFGREKLWQTKHKKGAHQACLRVTATSKYCP